MLRTLSLAACFAVAGSAQAAFVGGGVISTDAWNSAATTAIGQAATVYRLYAAFDGTDLNVDTVNSVFNAEFDTGLTLFHEAAFGADTQPNDALFGFAPAVQWDSFVTINAATLADGSAASLDPGFNFTPTGIGAGSGWFLAGSTQGNAIPDAEFGTGLNLVLLAQITVLDGGRGVAVTDIRTDGSMGDGGGVFAGGLSLGINDSGNPTIEGIGFVPTPGAVAIFGLAGLTAARRRRG